MSAIISSSIMLFVFMLLVSVHLYPMNATDIPLLPQSIIPTLYSIDLMFLYDRFSLPQVALFGSYKVDLMEKYMQTIHDQTGSSFFVSDFEHAEDHSQLKFLHFFGVVVIQIEFSEPTSKVQIMMADEVHVLESTMADGQELNCSRNTTITTLVTCTFGKIVAPGELEIKFTYSSHFSHQHEAFFENSSFCSEPTSFDNHLKWIWDSNNHIIVSTSNQPTGVRHLFPSFDEPMFKSRYQISIFAPNHMKAFSNEEVEGYATSTNTEIRHTIKKTQFKTTTIMSTYLVTVMIGQFTSSSSHMEHGITWTVVRRSTNVLNLVQFNIDSQSFMKRAINFYAVAKSWLGMDPILFAKMDFIENGCTLAMENPGIIQLSNSLLVLEERLRNCRNCSDTDLYTLHNVVAHEIVHQWFGNLVTMRWWNDLWLNEGIASYMDIELQRSSQQYLEMPFYFIGKILPRDKFVVNMDHDDEVIAFQNLSIEVDSHRGLFALAVYKKSALVLRMLEVVVGRKTFFDGLKLYLNRYKHSVVTADNFFDSMQQSVNTSLVIGPENRLLDVKNFLHEWVFRESMPLVRINRSGDNIITFAQVQSDGFRSPLWKIPISLRIQTGTTANLITFWLTEKEQTLAVEYDYNTSLIFLHDHPSVLYRVFYDDLSLKIIYETFTANCNCVSVESMTVFYLNDCRTKDRRLERERTDMHNSCLSKVAHCKK